MLLPVTYSKGGRYTHDPAEWSPIMRNTKSSVFPGLNSGLALSVLRERSLSLWPGVAAQWLAALAVLGLTMGLG